MFKFFFFLFLYNSLLFSCSGNCFECHPSLKKNIDNDINHKPMLTCINCHKKSSTKQDSCGSDCFECHPVNKILKKKYFEHKIILTCIECHKEKELFNSSSSFETKFLINSF